METVTARRPLKTRQAAWAGALARLLVRSGVSLNAISIASVFFALGGAAALYFSATFGAHDRECRLHCGHLPADSAPCAGA